jgi:hypothetical protein
LLQSLVLIRSADALEEAQLLRRVMEIENFSPQRPLLAADAVFHQVEKHQRTSTMFLASTEIE